MCHREVYRAFYCVPNNKAEQHKGYADEVGECPADIQQYRYLMCVAGSLQGEEDEY